MPKKITVIDRPALDLVSNALDTELVKLGKKLGLSFKAKGGIYSNSVNGSVKIEFVVISEGQEGKDPTIIKAEAGWEENAKLFGLKTKWLGKSITFKGEKVKILGLMPTRPRFPVLVKGSDGKPFLLTAMTVKDALGRKAM